MNRKTVAVIVAWAALAVCSSAARSASAQSTCSADSECATGATCVEIEATGCIDTCANNGGCVGLPCAHSVKACVSTCSQDSDCTDGKYCQFSTAALTCPSDAGAGGNSGSADQGCIQTYSFGQCMYHPLGSIPDGSAGVANDGEALSAAGISDAEGGAKAGDSAGQTSSTPTAQDGTPGTAASTSGGCAVAFGASNAGSVGVLLFGFGVVAARRRRRAADRESRAR